VAALSPLSYVLVFAALSFAPVSQVVPTREIGLRWDHHERLAIYRGWHGLATCSAQADNCGHRSLGGRLALFELASKKVYYPDLILAYAV
jgi:hypothetical protein